MTVQGNQPKDLANAMIRDSDVVLLLTPSGMERYIPAKLFEYLASGKPVLVHGSAGEASRIVKELGAGFFIPTGNVSALAEALDIPPSSLSFHLSQLTGAGLIEQQRDGRSLIYSANYRATNALVTFLTENCCSGAPCPADKVSNDICPAN